MPCLFFVPSLTSCDQKVMGIILWMNPHSLRSCWFPSFSVAWTSQLICCLF